jgi:hypothetical protein
MNGNVFQGSDSVNWTVSGSGVSNRSTRPTMPANRDWLSMWRWRLNTTASASSGVPSVNVTPSRRRSVHSEPSSLPSNDSASWGSYSSVSGL